jgi:hypothetical protein
MIERRVPCRISPKRCDYAANYDRCGPLAMPPPPGRLCLSTCGKLNCRQHNLRSGDMKILAAILLGGSLMAAPALAQDNGAGKDDMAKKPEAHHMMRHRERYKRDYKTDQEEHQATEDLNKQYRGVNGADAH